MTDEQNKPVWSREEQVEALTRRMRWDAKREAEAYILEAEARGAAEQRRKDAEGSIPCHQYFIGGYWVDCSPERYSQVMSCPTRILYTHPANVAALEDRIEGLSMTLAHSDGVRNEKQKRITSLEDRVRELERENAELRKHYLYD